MSYLYNNLGGLGRSKVAVEPLTGTRFEYLFPLTQQNGFYEEWPEESFFHKLISLDISNPSITEIKFLTGFWAVWDMNYENLPIPIEVALEIVKVLNNQGLAGNNNIIKIYPKFDTLPDRFFEVNYIGGGIKLANKDKADRYASNYGLRLVFKLKTTLPNIDIQGVPAPGAPEGGSYSLPHYGELET